MDKPRKLSEAIRLGSAQFKECIFGFWYPEDKPTCACAVGTAFLACEEPTALNSGEIGNMFTYLSARFDVPVVMISRASYLHFSEQMTRAEIADWFEKQGY